jgi:hypothetical protein
MSVALVRRSEDLVPAALERTAPAPAIAAPSGVAPAPTTERLAGAERLARAELRRQIATLEGRLGRLFAASFPRQGIEWGVGAVGGPRVLDLSELERVRDALAARLHDAQAELSRRTAAEEASRDLLERMIADPGAHRWLRLSARDVGEHGCTQWQSRPRWGILGMLMGWWRVKLSSGCPLAAGRGLAATPRPPAGA